jgi:4a-hydroxytetrahydrobiopterin dehydratase
MSLVWQETEEHLSTEVVFADFSNAFAFIAQLALVSEKMNHHPDIHWVYNRIRLHLSTHDAEGSVTDKDRALARAIDSLMAE